MAENVVNITVTGKDQASPALKSAADTGHGLGGMFDSVGQKAGGLGSILGGALKVGALAGGAGLLGVGFALKGFIEDAAASQAIMTQTNAVLASTKGISGMTADSVSDLAASLSKVIPIDDEVIQATENMLLTFTNVGKDVFPGATEAALDMATALGEDSVDSAMRLGKALNDPIQGVTALRRVGVQLTDQQEAQIKAMMAVGDVAGAQKIILGELATEFGNSGRAAGETFAGKMKILGTQIGNVKESIGMALLPVVSKLADALIAYVIPAFEDGVQAASDFADLIKSALTGDVSAAAEAFNKLPGPLQVVAMWLGENRDAIVRVVEKLADFAKAAGEIALDVIVDSLSGWKDILVALWPKLQDFGQFIVDHKPLMIALAVAVGVLVAALIGIPVAIAAVIVGVGLLAAHWDSIKAKTIEVWNAIDAALGGALTNIVSLVKSQFDAIRTEIESAFEVVKDIFKIAMALIHGDWGKAWDGIKALVHDVITLIWDDIKRVMDLVVGVFTIEWDAVNALTGGALDELKGNVTNVLGDMRDVATYAIEFIKNTIVQGFGYVQGAVGAIWSGIEDAIVDPIRRIIDWIQRVIDKARDLANLGGIAGSIISHAMDLVGFAGGGVSAGGLAIVGERGPELVALPGGSRVFSNSESRQMVGGEVKQTIYITNWYQTGDAAAGIASLGSMVG